MKSINAILVTGVENQYCDQAFIGRFFEGKIKMCRNVRLCNVCSGQVGSSRLRERDGNKVNALLLYSLGERYM